MTTRTVFILILLLGASTSSAVFAQPPPASPANPPTPGFAPAEAAPFRASQVGDTTRYLLQLQADGSAAGKPLPMLGDEASASYRRYLKSFEHPIPDFYQTTLNKTDDTGR
jgi:hypothetical protein